MNEAELNQLYWFVGFLVVSSFTSIVGSVVVLVKVAFWAGGFKKEIEIDRKDIKAAHDKIRELKKERENEQG